MANNPMICVYCGKLLVEGDVVALVMASQAWTKASGLPAVVVSHGMQSWNEQMTGELGASFRYMHEMHRHLLHRFDKYKAGGSWTMTGASPLVVAVSNMPFWEPSAHDLAEAAKNE